LNAASVKRLVVAIGTTKPLFFRPFEVLFDLGGLLGRCVDGDEIVVVKIDAIGARRRRPCRKFAGR